MKTESILAQFDKIADEVIRKAEVFSFNLKDLPDLDEYRTNLREHPKFSGIFSSLDQKLNHCLYWFELASAEHGNYLQDLLNTNREILKANARTVPAQNRNRNSNILYVGIRRGGKRKRDGLTFISGRLSIHLGYYNKGTTQGLQLVHWAKDVDSKINIKVVEFKNLPDAYLNVIEEIVAFKLKPLCGKH